MYEILRINATFSSTLQPECTHFAMNENMYTAFVYYRPNEER